MDNVSAGDVLPIRQKASNTESEGMGIQSNESKPTTTDVEALSPVDDSQSSLVCGSKLTSSHSSLPPTSKAVGEDMTAACARVFGTVELLTTILKFCTLKTLLITGPRVNRTWKSIIDNNKNIQHHLFFQPFGYDDYVHRWIEINPFLRKISYARGEEIEEGCDWDWGPGVDGDSDDEDWNGGPHRYDAKMKIKREIDWRKIESDERFMREEASWRWMLPVQPPAREIFNFYRNSTSFQESDLLRVLNPHGRGHPTTLGQLHGTLSSIDGHQSCLRTRTWIRTSERWIISLQVNVDVKPISCEEDLLHPSLC